jgi:hypothetical protein
MRRRGDFLDARISQTAIDLFVLGRNMLHDGVDPASREWCEVAFALNRELKLPPWAEIVWILKPTTLPLPSWRAATGSSRVSSIGSWRRPIAAGALTKNRDGALSAQCLLSPKATIQQTCPTGPSWHAGSFATMPPSLSARFSSVANTHLAPRLR